MKFGFQRPATGARLGGNKSSKGGKRGEKNENWKGVTGFEKKKSERGGKGRRMSGADIEQTEVFLFPTSVTKEAILFKVVRTPSENFRTPQAEKWMLAENS